MHVATSARALEAWGYPSKKIKQNIDVPNFSKSSTGTLVFKDKVHLHREDFDRADEAKSY